MKKSLLTVIAALLSITLSAQTSATPGDHEFKTSKMLEVFNAIYKNLDMIYVDTLDAEEVVGTAIDAMLASLDPYTEYYPEDKAGDLKMMISGKYAGIGALIRQDLHLGTVVVDEPYEGMPASEVGLKKGDIILSIDDSTMIGKPVSYVSSHLRGDAGSTFVLKVKRPTESLLANTTTDYRKIKGKTLRLKVTRRSIQMPAVTYYGLQDDGIGYLLLSAFTEGCSKDVRRAYLEMHRQGMKSFVLDLRGNGGGSLQEAVNILNMFVPKDITLVKTQGKLKRANSEYRTRVEPIDTLMPMVVLVNGNSASASEITSGTLQDLDRAVVLGQRTYGKGLVQLPNLPLPYNGNLKVTSGKYFIPSGRCIQAINYKRSKDDGQHRGSRYGERLPDSLTTLFHTANGRPVRDGGGIAPDIEVKADSVPSIAYWLASTGRDSTEVMLHWEMDYLRRNPQVAPASSFELSDADYEDFKQAVINSGFRYDRESNKFIDNLEKLAKFEGYYDDARSEFEALRKKLSHNLAKDLDYNKTSLRQLLTSDLATAYYYQRGAAESQLRFDKQWQEAVKLLKDPERYRQILSPKP